jgi:signal peptidase II
MKKRDFIFFTITLLVLIIDQLTKYFVKANLTLSESVPVINNIFHITLIQNFGISFGMLNVSALRWIFVIITVIIVGIILYYYKQIKKQFPLICTALILGGALGNLMDRILLGFIVDFIDFRIWPAFNIADAAITLGVIALIVYYWKK